MSALKLYDRVRVATNRFVTEGAPHGTSAYIVEDYGCGSFEIEVSEPATGETLALITATRGDLVSDEP